MLHTLKIALRDLGRNRRRSFFSALALGLGLALLLMIASFINGEVQAAMTTSIKLQSGHLQVRAPTYDDTKNSLAYEDLLANPDGLVAKIAALPQVKVATPRLFASGFITQGEESFGVRVVGIDPASPANDPFRQGMLTGQFLTADDREGVLIGQLLADKLSLRSGDIIHLVVNTSNGGLDDQTFTIRGTYTTHTPGYDKSTVFLPLAKAQAITQTENHASTIFILLQNRDQADLVAAAVPAGYQAKTWKQLNDLLVQTEALYSSYMVLFYMIVLGITATVIVNTLIMSVFERTREIGILSAIGMKSSRIMAMFFAESGLLAVGGILIGLSLGAIVVGYLTVHGFPLPGDYGISGGSGGMLLGDTIYASLTVSDAVSLTLAAFVITLLAGLYPAVMAARMEPVEALHGGK